MCRRLSGGRRIGHVSIWIRFLPTASPARTALPSVDFELNAAIPASDLMHKVRRREARRPWRPPLSCWERLKKKAAEQRQNFASR
jgi:hypothetical protein